jgi:hypothetical protein
MIYFTLQNFRALPQGKQEKLRQLCRDTAGEYDVALWDYLTTEKGYVGVSMDHNLSQATLFRCVKRFYESFPKAL